MATADSRDELKQPRPAKQSENEALKARGTYLTLKAVKERGSWATSHSFTVKARPTGGSTMVFTTGFVVVLCVIGVALLGLLSLFGGQSQTNNAEDAAVLAIGKEALRYPYYDLNTAGPTEVPDAAQFMGVGDDSPAGDGHKVINLSNINRVWGQALLAAINLEAMMAESGKVAVKDDPTEQAYQRVLSLHRSAESISKILKEKLEQDPETQKRFKKLAEELIAANKDKYVSAQSAAVGDHNVSFLNRGLESNVELNAHILDDIGFSGSSTSTQGYHSWLTDADAAVGCIEGYTDDVKITFPDKEPLTFHFVPLRPKSTPHLTSLRQYSTSNSPSAGDKPFKWENAVPNSFSITVSKAGRINDHGVLLSSTAAVISELVGQAAPVAIPRGYIQIENADGLNLESASAGRDSNSMLTYLAQAGGCFSAADYANAQLLVQRSLQDPHGGSRHIGKIENFAEDKFEDIANPKDREFILKLEEKVRALIDNQGNTDNKHNLATQKADGNPASVEAVRNEIIALVESINTPIPNPGLEPVPATVRQALIAHLLRQFGAMPDPQRYPLQALLSATLTSRDDARWNFYRGIPELGTVENCYIQSRHARKASQDKTVVTKFTESMTKFLSNGETKSLPPFTGTMIAGMGVLPHEPGQAEGGQRNPLRKDKRILSGAFRSPTPLDGGLRISRDGSPYEYLQGDDLPGGDLVAQKTDTSPADGVTPTCSIVRRRLIQRIRELDPTINFADGVKDQKLKNLLHFGYAVDRIEDVAYLNPQPKRLKMGSKAFIFIDKVPATPTPGHPSLNMVVMKNESELTTTDWLKKVLGNHAPEAEGKTILFQGRFFDGTNHRLTDVQLNIEGDYGYSRPYHDTTDICVRDRYKWTPASGANHGLLGVLRFETTINNGKIEENKEQTEINGALNFGQIFGPTEEYEEPCPCQGTGCYFGDPFGFGRGKPPSALGKQFNADGEWGKHLEL